MTVSNAYQVRNLIVYCIKKLSSIISKLYMYVPVNCHNGDVRLVEGSSTLEGRVEVCIGQRWGTVCHNYWSASDGQVVCRQLGYSTEGIILYSLFIILCISNTSLQE